MPSTLFPKWHRLSVSSAILVFVPCLLWMSSSCAFAQETSMSLVSDTGDSIGGGRSYYYGPADGAFFLQRNDKQGISVAFNSFGSTEYWYMDFAAADGVPLIPGTYVGAVRYPFQGLGEPGLSVWGNGRGCNTLTGAFTVRQLTYSDDNQVSSFWATFEQHCEGRTPALRGDIRYNASVTVIVDSPASQEVGEGAFLGFLVRATDVAARHVTLTATGLPSGAKFTDVGDNTGHFGWTPRLDQAGRYTVTFHGDNNEGGIDSSSTLITVIGQSSLVMASEAGDYVGQGRSYAFTSNVTRFVASQGHGNAAAVSVRSLSGANAWNLEFAAPADAPLTVGVYQDAERYPYPSSGGPAMSVSGDGRGCNTLIGEFEIKKVAFDSENRVTSLWVLFEQHCEGAVPALRGELRFNADVVVEVTAPLNKTVEGGQTLALAVTASDVEGRHVTLRAEGVPAGASFADHGDNTGTLTWQTTRADVGVYTVTFHGDNDSGGVDSTVTRIEVTGVTSLRMASDPGDPIGQGQPYLYTPADSDFRVRQYLNTNAVEVTVRTPDQSEWNLKFGSADGSRLTPGAYENTACGLGTGAPMLEITGNYKSCSSPPCTGRFVVRQVEYGEGREIDVLWASFELYCRGIAGPRLAGEIRYRADVVVDVQSAGSVPGMRGSVVAFDVTAVDVRGGQVALSASGLPEGASFVERGDNTGRFEWIPAVSQVGFFSIYFRGESADGLTGEATTRIHVPGVTSLALTSEPGDMVGNGQQYYYSVYDGAFQARPNEAGGISIEVNGLGPQYGHWSLDFCAAGGVPLTPGTYAGAIRYPGDAEHAGLTVSSHVICDQTGTFQVREVRMSPDHQVLSFWATFVQNCTGSPQSLIGDVRYDAACPVTVVAPVNTQAREGQRVAFVVRATSAAARRVSMAATDLPQGAIFTDRGDGTAVFEWTPGPTQAGLYSVLFRGDDGQGGEDTFLARVRVENVPQPPVPRAGGPYAGVSSYAVQFDGSGSSDPDSDPLSYAWDFGDFGTGEGARPSHVYAAARAYRVILTVSDGTFSVRDTTTASIVDPQPARAYAMPGQETIRTFSGKPYACYCVEPIADSYRNSDVVLASFLMVANQAGSSATIAAITDRTGLGGDRDRNGIAEIEICFAKEDLRTLFGPVTGMARIPVTLAADLIDGRKLSAPLEVEVVGRAGPNIASAWSANPSSRSATLRFTTTRPGPAQVTLHDLRGRVVRQLMHEASLPEGEHSLSLSSGGGCQGRFPRGVLFYRIETVEGTTVGKIIIVD